MKYGSGGRFKTLAELKKYKAFKREVLQRDGYTCRWPGCQANVNLEMHHILQWSKYPKLRYEKSNCISLCQTHHSFIFSKEEKYVTFFSDILKTNPDANNINRLSFKPFREKYKYKKGPAKRAKKRKR